MSTSPEQRLAADGRADVDAEAVTDVTPVSISASSLDATAPAYLRDLKADLAADGCQPAVLTASARFDENCPLATQTEVDDLRAYVRAAAFLGAGRLELAVEEAANDEAVRTALRALEERARREGVTLSVSGATPR